MSEIPGTNLVMRTRPNTGVFLKATRVFFFLGPGPWGPWAHGPRPLDPWDPWTKAPGAPGPKLPTVRQSYLLLGKHPTAPKTCTQNPHTLHPTVFAYMHPNVSAYMHPKSAYMHPRVSAYMHPRVSAYMHLIPHAY